MNSIFASYDFAPVMVLPKDYEVYDFSTDYDPNRTLKSPFGIGKYNEKRQNMYNQDLFEGSRNIHMGIDIGAPVGTPVMSFYQGQLAYMDYNSAKGDYGYTLVTKHQLGDKELFALYGHLSASSLENKKIGQKISKGEVIAWLGDKHENGGWNSHLHFQLSWKDPLKADMPGAVADKDRAESLLIFPDPQNVLGKLY